MSERREHAALSTVFHCQGHCKRQLCLARDKEKAKRHYGNEVQRSFEEDLRFAVRTISTSVSSMISDGEFIIWRMLLEL